MTHRQTINIPIGYVASFTTDAMTSGTYTRIDQPGGAGYAPVTVNVSTDYALGPFNEPRNYALDLGGNKPAVSFGYSGVLTADDEASYALLAPKASPTFTGTVVLPSTTSIGTVSATELSYVDGVTSAIQTQLTAKAVKTVATIADLAGAALLTEAVTALNSILAALRTSGVLAP